MAIVWTPTAAPTQQDLGFGAATATFSSVPLGTAVAGRVIVVQVFMSTGGATGSTCSISSVTCGGVGMTSAVQAASPSTGDILATYYCTLATGTAANVVVNVTGVGGVIDWIGITAGNLTGSLTSPDALVGSVYNEGQADPQVATSVIISSGGIALIGGIAANSSGSAFTSNFTFDFVSGTAGGSNIAGFSGHFSGTGSFAAQYSGAPFAGNGLVVTTWTISASPFIPFDPWTQWAPLIAQ